MKDINATIMDGLARKHAMDQAAQQVTKPKLVERVFRAIAYVVTGQRP